MTKKGGWALTEAGAHALDSMPDKSAVYPVLHKLYRHTIKMREAETTQKDPRWATVELAMSLIPDGSWTAYKDLGELVGLPGLNVGQFIAKNDVPNAQRVLQVSGTVASEFPWFDPERTDDPRQMLVDEGIEFDAADEPARHNGSPPKSCTSSSATQTRLEHPAGPGSSEARASTVST